MTVFFTSDTHFGHANILTRSNRGNVWGSVEEMDEGLISRWNSVVGKRDTVYHLGDFSWKPKETDAILRRLNGAILYLVSGNHDSTRIRNNSRFQLVTPMMIVKGIDDLPVTLCHYGMRVWNQSHHGALHFYGHSHGSLPGNSQSCDVGVDVPEWDYTPVSLETIRKHLETLPDYRQEDYHNVNQG